MTRFKFHEQGGDRGHSLRGVGYRLTPAGPLHPLIDGRTGEPATFPKAEVYAACYSKRNEVFYVLKAMERFDELKVVG